MPTMGADESLFLSLEYFLGRLATTKVRQKNCTKDRQNAPGGIYIRAVVYQEFDNLHIAACTGSMKRQNAIEDRVNGLAIVESILDQPNVARGCGRMETKTGD